jgi:anti-sigma28 factor (negative regulator of flagellin synthesis)
MQMNMETTRNPGKLVPGVERVARIARPESVVLLAATVRAALDVRGERVDGLKAQLTDGAYSVPTRRLAERVLRRGAPSA